MRWRWLWRLFLLWSLWLWLLYIMIDYAIGIYCISLHPQLALEYFYLVNAFSLFRDDVIEVEFLLSALLAVGNDGLVSWVRGLVATARATGFLAVKF